MMKRTIKKKIKKGIANLLLEHRLSMDHLLQYSSESLDYIEIKFNIKLIEMKLEFWRAILSTLEGWGKEKKE